MIAAALMAGCSKDADVAPADGAKGKIHVTGRLAENSTRVTIGDYTNGDPTVPVYWENGDKILMGLIDMETGKGVARGDNDNAWYGTTGEVKDLTGRSQVAQFDPFMPEYMSLNYKAGNAYFAIHTEKAPGLALDEMDAYPATRFWGDVPNPGHQTYNVETGRTSGYLLTAINEQVEPADATEASVDFAFSNAMATIMVGIKGEGTIGKLKLSMEQLNLNFASTEGLTINMSHAPQAGSSADDIFASKEAKSPFFNDGAFQPADYVNEIEVVFSKPVTLGEEYVWVPVNILPQGYINSTTIFVSFFSSADSTDAVAMREIVSPSEVSAINTNDIVYLAFKDIEGSIGGGEGEGPTGPNTFKGFSDNFRWIYPAYSELNPEYLQLGYLVNAAVAYPYSPKIEVPGMGTMYRPLGTTLRLSNDGSEFDPTTYGWTIEGSEYGLQGFPNGPFQGFVSLTDLNNATSLIYPLTELGGEKANLTITFDAMAIFDAEGNLAELNSDILNGVRVTVVKPNAQPIVLEQLGKFMDPFTWYHFSMVVEDVTGDTVVKFGDDAGFLLDNVSIQYTQDGDENDYLGTPVVITVIPAEGFFQTLPSNGNGKIGATKYTKDFINPEMPGNDVSMFSFTPWGGWSITISEGAEWLGVAGPSIMVSNIDSLTPDFFMQEMTYGSQMPEVFYAYAKEDNTTGAERTATVTVTAGSETRTFTFVQPAAEDNGNSGSGDIGSGVIPMPVG